MSAASSLRAAIGSLNQYISQEPDAADKTTAKGALSTLNGLVTKDKTDTTGKGAVTTGKSPAPPQFLKNQKKP